jgi:hypothetical protein
MDCGEAKTHRTNLQPDSTNNFMLASLNALPAQPIALPCRNKAPPRGRTGTCACVALSARAPCPAARLGGKAGLNLKSGRAPFLGRPDGDYASELYGGG